MIKDENAGYKALWYLLGLTSIVISTFCESSGSSYFWKACLCGITHC